MADNDPGVLARPSQEKEGSADRLWRAMNGLDERMAEAHARFALQANGVSGSSSSPVQTSELEDAGIIALGNSLK